jgi:DNA gyrase inhibitor GyrI
MKKMLVPSLILVAVVVLILVGCKATRSGYESAPYKVVRADGKFEVRDYPALKVVETRMAKGGNGSDGSFNRLFQFITGKNEAKQKISMTTPVFMSDTDSNATMAFVMPAKLKEEDVPKPTDSSVSVREVPPGRFAVLRFSGGRNAKNEAKQLERLKTWMADVLPPMSLTVYSTYGLSHNERGVVAE